MRTSSAGAQELEKDYVIHNSNDTSCKQQHPLLSFHPLSYWPSPAPEDLHLILCFIILSLLFPSSLDLSTVLSTNRSIRWTSRLVSSDTICSG